MKSHFECPKNLHANVTEAGYRVMNTLMKICEPDRDGNKVLKAYSTAYLRFASSRYWYNNIMFPLIKIVNGVFFVENKLMKALEISVVCSVQEIYHKK